MNRSLIMAFAAMATLAASARQLTPDQAISRVYGSGVSRSAAIGAADAPRLAFTATDRSERPTAYVFTQAGNQGYMVVSADDVAVPLLGYADNGTFDADNIPANMQWWLDEYSRQIAAAVDNGETAPWTMSEVGADRKPIAPLLATKWDQNSPYNDRCPEYTAGNHCPTGCVATAMAQVVKYHNYPDCGKGNVAYQSSIMGYLYNVAFDFDNTPFSFDLMTDTYGEASSAGSRAAVADLMLACGASTGMLYTPDMSGARSSEVADALVDNFLYDPATVVYRERDWYDCQDWEDLIYNDLATVGPVYYGGNNIDSGHAFVCDGYSSDGYFHFNWGWSGVSDGYFRLTALDPANQGTGGSAAGYTWFQCVVTGVQPPKPGSIPAAIMILDSSLTPSVGTASAGDCVTFTGHLTNHGRVDMTGVSVSMRYSRADGSAEPVYVATDVTSSSLEVGQSISAVKSDVPEGLSDGVYRVAMVFRANGSTEWIDVQGANTYIVNSLSATVEGRRISFGTEGSSLAVNSMAMESPVVFNRNFLLRAELGNTGDAEFHSTLCGAFFNKSNRPVAMCEVEYVDLMPGETMQLEYYSNVILINGSEWRAGTWSFAFMDYDMYYRSGKTEVKIFGTPMEVTVQPAMSAGTLERKTFAIESADAVNPELIRAQATVACTDGYFGDRLMIVVNDRTPDYQFVELGRFYSRNPVFLEKGSEGTAMFEFALPQAEPGHTYYAMLWYPPYAAQLGRFVQFTIDSSAAIDDVEAADTDATVEYFNLQGMPVNPDNLRRGEVYIRRIGTTATKVRY